MQYSVSSFRWSSVLGQRKNLSHLRKIVASATTFLSAKTRFLQLPLCLIRLPASLILFSLRLLGLDWVELAWQLVDWMKAQPMKEACVGTTLSIASFYLSSRETFGKAHECESKKGKMMIFANWIHDELLKPGSD